MGLISIPYFIKLKIENRKLSLRWATSDVNVFYHTIVEKEFFIPFIIENVNFIVDAGANIGITSILFQKLYPLSTIIAIEPELNNFEFLKINTSVYPQINVIQKGLWHSVTYLKISNPCEESWAFKTEEVLNGNKYDIEAISINRILEEYNVAIIDILKIDIEGAELELFSKNMDKWMPLTRFIIIELHGKECRSVFLSAIEMFGFKHIYTNGENECYANSNLLKKCN